MKKKVDIHGHIYFAIKSIHTIKMNHQLKHFTGLGDKAQNY
jgi:hypothetical protein